MVGETHVGVNIKKQGYEKSYENYVPVISPVFFLA